MYNIRAGIDYVCVCVTNFGTAIAVCIKNKAVYTNIQIGWSAAFADCATHKRKKKHIHTDLVRDRQKSNTRHNQTIAPKKHNNRYYAFCVGIYVSKEWPFELLYLHKVDAA